MSAQVLADTHALLWYLFDEKRLSSAAREALDSAIGAGFPILASAISMIEVVYLEEKPRIRAGAVERIRRACEVEDPSLEIVLVDARVAYGIHQIARTDVPDIPDRVIAATTPFRDQVYRHLLRAADSTLAGHR